MTPQGTPRSSALWARQGRAWRDPAQVLGLWEGAAGVAADLLRFQADEGLWAILDELDVTLLVSREYEHLLVALSVVDGRPSVTHLTLPHPSGIAFDAARGCVHIASTRNPNQLFEFRPAGALLDRADVEPVPLRDRPLIPVSSRLLPGSLYLHDLAMVGGRLHGNAVGHNAVVDLEPAHDWRHVWWPRAIERTGPADFRRNYLQLNSIAAGESLASSAFTASGAEIGRRRPGHRNYAVDRRGVVFDGASREVMARGFTRPHSARFSDERLWINDSGYGALTVVNGEGFNVVSQLPGWTRGLALRAGIAFVGTSRVIPRFRSYAPGLDVEASTCGVHAIDISTGRSLGGLTWKRGNQVFAVEPVPRQFSLGLPYASVQSRSRQRISDLFYAFDTSTGRT